MLISAENLSFGFEGNTLLKSISFTISEGDRVGLIGANGEGKTTLIRLILSELTPEEGNLFCKNGICIGYLPQNGGYDSENTVYEEMQEIFKEDKRLILALRDVEQQFTYIKEGSQEFKVLSSKYDALTKKIAARDSYQYEVKIKTVLNGMGFGDFYSQKISTMSGGEKTRLKLCRLLLEQPDLLILDEPTNHLDIKTLFWLEDYLSNFKGAILTVSHDRYFLDKIVTQIYELEQKKLWIFKGNYTKYKVLKQEQTTRLLKEYEKQQEEIAHLQDYVDKNLTRASTAKSALSRVKKLEKMEVLEKPAPPQTPPRFVFNFLEKPYENVLKVENMTLTGGDKILLENASFDVMRGEKCAVTGDNGTGKSTLVKEIIKGKNPNIKLGRFVKIAYYDQENANLDGDNTVLDELWGRHISWEQTKVRNILAQAKLSQEDMQKKVKVLSGGERAKLALAVFECENGNFLILDEPTNHLDLPARESLEEALKAFDGTVLFVSHDRYFISALADKVIELSGGGISSFKGTYEEYNNYKNTLINQKEEIIQKVDKVKEKTYKSRQEKGAENKKKIRIKQIENEISSLEEKEENLNQQLADPSITADYEKVTNICNELETIKNNLDSLYEEYETLI